jgi:hypothetical protein
MPNPPTRFELLRFLFENQSQQARTSNGRWAAAVVLGFASISVQKQEKSGVPDSIIFLDTYIEWWTFAIVAVVIISVLNVAFVSAFRAANKTGAVIDAVLQNTEMADVWEGEQSDLYKSLRDRTRAATIPDALGDIVRTGMGQDFVRIHQAFDALLIPRPDSEKIRNVVSLKVIYSSIKFWFDTLYLFIPISLGIAFYLLELAPNFSQPFLSENYRVLHLVYALPFLISLSMTILVWWEVKILIGKRTLPGVFTCLYLKMKDPYELASRLSANK